MNTRFNTSTFLFGNKRQINHIDAEIILGIKSSDPAISEFYVKRLFYIELKALLTTIQYSLYKGTIEYDELVNELYIHLSRNNWDALDSYRGDNKARLSTWLSRVAWRFFMNSYRKSARMTSDEGSTLDCVKSAEILSDVDIRMDIEKVMKMMPNRRYAEVLKLNLYYGYSAEDIAVILDTTVSNVYNIKHRAVMQFISIYGQRDDV
ncbi:MAG: sigma-70 family RNA polymerase sigma factor [Bacteroidales bacterium]|nr:sigma-70 family RNA polymerase sigma factor [Bacteroidales bacterium]